MGQFANGDTATISPREIDVDQRNAVGRAFQKGQAAVINPRHNLYFAAEASCLECEREFHGICFSPQSGDSHRFIAEFTWCFYVLRNAAKRINVRKADVTCACCGAGFRRLELWSEPGAKGEYRCPVCDYLLEAFDGTNLIAYRLTIQPVRAPAYSVKPIDDQQ
ncbi:DNA-directed RNA polymerase subunit RPC12/RpoP [Bradyrhizobium sp. USDA 4501]|uniref:hypothetical protein n=1 Tax=Bradyrhizobium brasilense TaxID=1419277 RepID=UPI001F26BC82|nr:hypothetical protein [Bradyrhizobium brasilense]MCP1908409.1 DNA-directed RNA polymerase subunit RPC12/RpoP [Bradyrhizobium elkanii]